MQIEILDCSLRDGGYHNNWHFHRHLVENYLNCIPGSGINVVEIGFRTPHKEGLGPYAYSTDDLLLSLPLPDACIDVMVNANEFTNVSKDINSIFDSAANSPVSMVRIASHFNTLMESAHIAQELRRLGYKVGFNIMQIAGKPTEMVESVAKEVVGWNCVDVLYFADSFGNLNAEGIKKAIDLFRMHWNGDIGVHCHNNKGIALSNTIAAIDNGATWVDSTMAGMGRGAGNTHTEFLLIELSLIGVNCSPLKAFDAVGDFEALREEYRWGTNLFYYVSAIWNIHPMYAQTMISKYQHKDIIRCLSKLKDSPNFLAEKIEEVLQDE